MDLTLETRDLDGRAVVVVGGEVDVYTAPRLRDCLTDLVSAGRHHVVVDMTGVAFLDSTGLGVLVGALKKVRAEDGSLEIVCSSQRLLRIFSITGLSSVFTIHDSTAALSPAG